MLEEVMHTYPVGSATIRAYIAVTFNGSSRVTGRRREAEEVGTDLASRLPVSRRGSPRREPVRPDP